MAAPASTFTPVRFWLANPQLRLQVKVPGTRDYLTFNNGKFTAKTKQEYDLIKATGRAYKDDGFRPKNGNPTTGYAPGSSEAFEEHLNYIPQG